MKFLMRVLRWLRRAAEPVQVGGLVDPVPADSVPAAVELSGVESPGCIGVRVRIDVSNILRRPELCGWFECCGRLQVFDAVRGELVSVGCLCCGRPVMDSAIVEAAFEQHLEEVARRVRLN